MKRSTIRHSAAAVFSCLGLYLTGCATDQQPDAPLQELGVVTRERTEYRGATKQYFRGGHQVLRETVVNGQVVRAYYVEGRLVVTESDEDGDGAVETMTVWPDGWHTFEVFRRGADGSVEPVQSGELQVFRDKIVSALGEFKKAQKSNVP